MRAWGAVVAGVLGLTAGAGVFAQTSRLPAERICERDRTHPSCSLPGAGATQQTAAREVNPWAPQPICERDPTRMSCETSGRGRTVGRGTGSPTSVVDPQRTGKAIGQGAAMGGVGGTAIALAACPPFIFGGPPLYAVCAMTGLVFGMMGGAIAGVIVDEAANIKPSKLSTAVPLAAAEKVVEESFDQALARAAGEKEHSAVAVAMGEGRWAWGVAGGMATQDEARWRALDYCNRHAARDAVHAACVIYQVDGQSTELVLK